MTERVVVAGSREIQDMNVVREAVHQMLTKWELEDPEIVSGGARGVDTLAAEYAAEAGHDYEEFPADWDDPELGKAAGPIRNSEMAEYGDYLIAIWNGDSAGTRDMIDKALDEGLTMHIEVYD